jgi:hypothetical protein
MRYNEFLKEDNDLECTKDDPCGYCKKCKERGTLKVTEADDFKAEIRKKKAFTRGVEDATSYKPKAVPQEFADYAQAYFKGYAEGQAINDHEDWREKTAAKRQGRHYHESIDDETFSGTRNMGKFDETVDEAERAEREDALTIFVQEWTDNEIGIPPASASVNGYSDIRVSTPRDKPHGQFDSLKAGVMKYEMRQMSDNLIEELRLADFGDYELSTLSPWHFSLSKVDELMASRGQRPKAQQRIRNLRLK